MCPRAVHWYDDYMKKAVLFGDSLFAQMGKQRLIMFEEALPGYDFYNCAAGGWDTNDCADKAPYIAGLKPDLVIISLGTNDAAPWKQVPLDTFRANIPKIFGAFESSRIVYFLPPPVNEQKIAQTEPNRSIEGIRDYHDAAKAVCEERGVAYIDSFAIFQPLLDGGTDYHVDDGVHFNDVAYELIARELARILAVQPVD